MKLTMNFTSETLPAFNMIVRHTFEMALFDCSSLNPKIRPLKKRELEIMKLVFKTKHPDSKCTYKLATSYGLRTWNAFNAPPDIIIHLAFRCETIFCDTTIISLR